MKRASRSMLLTDFNLVTTEKALAADPKPMPVMPLCLAVIWNGKAGNCALGRRRQPFMASFRAFYAAGLLWSQCAPP
ncbi:hypothetical protein D3C75_1150970 [compost metagenome]